MSLGWLKSRHFWYEKNNSAITKPCWPKNSVMYPLPSNNGLTYKRMWTFALKFRTNVEEQATGDDAMSCSFVMKTNSIKQYFFVLGTLFALLGLATSQGKSSQLELNCSNQLQIVRCFVSFVICTSSIVLVLIGSPLTTLSCFFIIFPNALYIVYHRNITVPLATDLPVFCFVQ